jgi:hypothetical protein
MFKLKLSFFLKIILLAKLVLFLPVEALSSNKKISKIFNENLNRFLLCTDKNIELIKYQNSKYQNYILVLEDLKIDCLQKQNLEISRFVKNNDYFSKMFKGKVYDGKYKINLINSEEDDFFYEIISIQNPFTFFAKCGDRCEFGNEEILKVNNKFYYMHHGHGGFNNFVKLQKKQLAKFSIQLTTHKRNFFFNIKKGIFSYLPDGDVKLYNSYYEVYWQKSYFKGGGAFWYNARRDYEGNLLEILPRQPNQDFVCVNRDRLSDEIKKFLIKSNKEEFCPSE